MKRTAIFIIACLLCMNMPTGFCQDNRFSVKTFNLGGLDWKLWGYRPEVWHMDFNFAENRSNGKADVRGIDADVPGSVQKALLDAGIIEDWNYGTNNEKIEWIEHRNWLFTAKLPDEWILEDKTVRLVFKGLDDNGKVLVNGKEAGSFDNTFIPYSFDITSLLKEKNNIITVAFGLPPRYLGQIGYTSKIKEWKSRFYYGWDWMPRIVQIGIWDDVLLEISEKDHMRITDLKVYANADRYKDSGELSIIPEMTYEAKKGKIRIELKDSRERTIIDETVPACELASGKTYDRLKIRRWYPNGEGEQPLYSLTCTLFDRDGNKRETCRRRIGFKSAVWEHNMNAPAGADPWICVVNDRPVFLQGINWTPIRPNFADLDEEQYKRLLQSYKDMGFNFIRIWGGGFPEKDWLYDICDEMGLMIHQDFPLSSSGLDNYPPENPDEIETMATIARNYLIRNRHHVSMLIWSGGNELYKRGDTGPVKLDHPMIRRVADIVAAEDPFRRFIPASPSGMNIEAGWGNFGSGRNWDTHGPWVLPYDRAKNDFSPAAIDRFWAANDALFISEMGAPGAMSAEMIDKYRGNCNAMPASHENPYWNQFNWWVEWDQYKAEHGGKEPSSIEEYVEWSQNNQTTGLTLALKNLKAKFPECGGLVIWMGHDSFPAPANTSIIDFDGNWKPAAYELQKILLAKPENLR